MGLLIWQGSANKNEVWYGRWEGTMNFTDAPDQDDVIARTINTARLDIRPDGTFSLVRGGVPVSGNHVLQGEKATLKVLKFMDRPIEDVGEGAVKMNKDIKLRLKEDGTVVLSDDFYDEDVLLTKQAQPKNP